MKLGNGTFLLGDCLEEMKRLDTGSIDLVLADLPYGTTQNKWDSIIPLQELWPLYWKVLKPNGAIVLTAQVPFNIKLAFSQIQHLKYEWIWVKSKKTGHLNAKKQPLKQHENVLVFYKRQPVYNPVGLTKKAVPTVRVGRDNGTNYGKSIKDALQEYENYPSSILTFASQGKNVHPTQKPVTLFEYLVKTYTDEGMIVLDNCAGSGTTAIACESTRRRWICIEKDVRYFQSATDRVKSYINQNAISVGQSEELP